jgi:hypothetical protein
MGLKWGIRVFKPKCHKLLSREVDMSQMTRSLVVQEGWHLNCSGDVV